MKRTGQEWAVVIRQKSIIIAQSLLKEGQRQKALDFAATAPNLEAVAIGYFMFRPATLGDIVMQLSEIGCTGMPPAEALELLSAELGE